tara:strand:+ start:5956 stop:6435 length:480 start_codon:yes stop_codon:yes gene_type:complete
MWIFDGQISTSIKPTRHKLNFKHFKYVIENCRKADDIEIQLTGFTKQSLINIYDELEDGLTGTEENNIPFLVAGTQVNEDEVWYWFLATPLVNHYWLRVTIEAKKLIQKKKKQHKDKRHLVQVWSGHKASISWLNILKFKEISHYYVGKEKILIVENRT